MLLLGAGSGYVTKVVQVICTILLLPFLLSDAQLGLAAFGHFSTLQASIAILTLLFDGWRQSTGRINGNRVATGGVSARDLSVMVSYSFFGVMVLAILATYGRHLVFATGNLSAVDGIEVVFYLLVGQLVIEQALFPAESLLHATGNTWRLNLVMAIEVVVRTAAIFAWFLTNTATIASYAGLIVIGATLRMLALLLLACRVLVPRSATSRPHDFRAELAAMRYSLVLTGSSAADYLVYRAPVILAARLISAEAAAILAVLLNNVPNYLRQLTLSVLRPMIIPLGARIDLATLSAAQQAKFRSLLATHQALACTTCAIVGATGWIWLDLWLGSTFADFAPSMNVLVMAIGLQIASAVQLQLLVAQGWGRPLALASILLGVLAFVSMVIAVTQGPALMLVVVAAYCTTFNGITVRELFLRMSSTKDTHHVSRTDMVALVVACVLASGLGFLVPIAGGDGKLLLKLGITGVEIAVVVFICLRYVAPWTMMRDAWHVISAAAMTRSVSVRKSPR
ncbi:MAG: hypothetical protein DYH20_05285 [Gammaproteobacteria bacterium PRO9]|nr:hypothetical protein [Gammaproteobacteria bacterium PRO9]